MLVVVLVESNVLCYNFYNCMYMEMLCIFYEIYNFFGKCEYVVKNYR